MDAGGPAEGGGPASSLGGGPASDNRTQALVGDLEVSPALALRPAELTALVAGESWGVSSLARATSFSSPSLSFPVCKMGEWGSGCWEGSVQSVERGPGVAPSLIMTVTAPTHRFRGTVLSVVSSTMLHGSRWLLMFLISC